MAKTSTFFKVLYSIQVPIVIYWECVAVNTLVQVSSVGFLLIVSFF